MIDDQIIQLIDVIAVSRRIVHRSASNADASALDAFAVTPLAEKYATKILDILKTSN